MCIQQVKLTNLYRCDCPKTLRGLDFFPGRVLESQSTRSVGAAAPMRRRRSSNWCRTDNGWNGMPSDWVSHHETQIYI